MLFILIGTVAEFIKLGPVIIALRDAGVSVVAITTGQNDLTTCDLYPMIFPNGVPVAITRRQFRPTVFSFVTWACECLLRAPLTLRRVFRDERAVHPRLIVHGDTISTAIGAFAGWMAGAEIIHIEAGLRSFHLLRPFPEELNRILVSRLATWAFCPGDAAVKNLEASGIRHIVNTQENTLLDSMRIALAKPCTAEILKQLPARYFLFICHRQENLFDQSFLRLLVSWIEVTSLQIPCVAVIHKPAANVFESLGLLSQLRGNRSILTVPRQGYITFTHMLQSADFIVTDGGSNQEESYYLGKPCLLLRKETERAEGLGRNVVLSNKDFKVIADFFGNPNAWKQDPLRTAARPAEVIVQHLTGRQQNYCGGA